MIIRKEKSSDLDAITEVTVAAFKDHPISNHTEQFIINALRAAGALTLSLVAEIDGLIVGHIAFSPVAISDGAQNWFGLGPCFSSAGISRTRHRKSSYSRRAVTNKGIRGTRMLPCG